MNKKIDIIFIISVILLLFSSCKKEKSENIPIVSKGFIDISQLDFYNSSIFLNGDWEFYPNKILSPSEINSGSNKSYLLKVPGLWNDFEYDNNKMTGKGYGTYRIKIQTKNNSDIFAIAIKRIQSSYKIFINGKEVYENGKLDTTAQNCIPKWSAEEFYTQPDKANIEIVIQVANFYHKKGGIENLIELGSKEKIQNSTTKSLILDSFLHGILLIMTLYHFGLFYLRRKDLSALFFGLFTLSTAAYSGTTGDMLLMKIFPDINWSFMVKLIYVSNYGRVVFIVLFVASIFENEISRKILKIISLVAIIMSAFSIIAPVHIFTNTLFIFILFALFSIFFLIKGLISATRKKIEGAKYSLIGAIILGVAAIHDIIMEYTLITTVSLSTFGVFAFIFFQSFMISLRSAFSFNSVKEITDRLSTLGRIKDGFLSGDSINLSNPLRVISQDANAGSSLLFVKHNDKWFAEAEYFAKENEVMDINILIEDNQVNNLNYSKNLIKETINSQKSFYIKDSDESISKEYMNGSGVRSILSFPIKEKGELAAILYLESNEENQTFNEKQQILDLLSSQLSILINNSGIYKELEDLNKNLDNIVKDRTAEVLQQKEEIESQKDEIEKINVFLNKAYEEIAYQNSEITEGVSYARRIQNSILSEESLITRTFNFNFIIYKPKEVLSGDFYRIDSIAVNNATKHIFSTGDCTGHGVSGALMSIIADNLLNYAIREQQIHDPAEILNLIQTEFRKRIIKDKKKISTDSIKMSIISYDKESRILKYSGAKNFAFLVRLGKVIVLEADRMSIGGFRSHKYNTGFSTKETVTQKGDILYLFTDGFYNQSNKEKSKKIGRNDFKNIIGSISNMPIKLQKDYLTNYLEDTFKVKKQTDDILIVGIKF